MEVINVAEAKSRLSELISRATSGERFVIHRRQHPVAALIGAADLERLERLARVASRLALALGQEITILEKIERRELHPAMAAFGLWRDENDLAVLDEEIKSDRLEPAAHPSLEL